MAICLTILVVFWIVVMLWISKYLSLILALYEIATQITFDQPMILVVAIGVREE